jgi:hypothetical protein
MHVFAPCRSGRSGRSVSRAVALCAVAGGITSSAYARGFVARIGGGSAVHGNIRRVGDGSRGFVFRDLRIRAERTCRERFAGRGKR